MNDTNLQDLEQVDQFLTGTAAVNFKASSRIESYRWIAKTLKRFGYHHLCKKEKGLICRYIEQVTGYSRQQVARLIAQHRETGWVGNRQRQPRHCFARLYTRADITLLAETDTWHQTLSGPATKKIFERAFNLFHDMRYERLAAISVAHIYNLRRSTTYCNQRRNFTKTKRSPVAIGERRKPRPQGQPGFIRIDTVHQGDEDGIKGVYHINAVDEVTQMEVICAVEKISERYLIPVLEKMIDLFPLKIQSIHADNGSEYINHQVADLLQKLFIELTKSRPRHSNDNALAESKNGSVIRKILGYVHIQQYFAPMITEFYDAYLNPYINFHRPCYFAVTVTDNKGKQKKTYPYEAIMTPYDKLKSLTNAEQYLKDSMTFAKLDELAYLKTDQQAAREMHQARKALFDQIMAIQQTKNVQIK